MGVFFSNPIVAWSVAGVFAFLALIVWLVYRPRRVIAQPRALLPEEEAASMLQQYPLLQIGIMLEVKGSNFDLDLLRQSLLGGGAEFPDSSERPRVKIKGTVSRRANNEITCYNFSLYCDDELIGALAGEHKNSRWSSGCPDNDFALALREEVISSLKSMSVKERARVLVGQQIDELRQALIDAGQPVPLLDPTEAVLRETT